MHRTSCGQCVMRPIPKEAAVEDKDERVDKLEEPDVEGHKYDKLEKVEKVEEPDVEAHRFDKFEKVEKVEKFD